MNKTSTNNTSATIPEKKDFPVVNGKKDYLQIDPQIPGQNFVCMSFISPEDMIQKRNLYYFNQFLYREVNKSLKDQAVHMAKEVNVLLEKNFEKRINKFKNSINEDERRLVPHLDDLRKGMKVDEEEFANKCMHLYKEDYDEVYDKFTMFQTQNTVELDKKFDQENDFKSSVRGFKVRGVYAERKEAELRCKEVRELAEPVNVFVAPVGYWCPWDPSPDAIQDSDYMVPALNTLMGKYYEGVRQKNQFFADRKQEMAEDAEKSNRERTKERLRKQLLEKQQAKIDTQMKLKKMEKAVNEEETKEQLQELMKKFDGFDDKVKKNKK